MHEKITDIQNSFWNAHKRFMRTKDMRQYNKDLGEIMKRYAGDPPLREFCEDLIWSWGKLINGIKEGEYSG